MFNCVIIWNTESNQKATRQEIEELIDNNLFINYCLSDSQEEGKVFIDIHNADKFVIKYT